MMIIYLYTGCASCLPLKNLSIEFTRLNRSQFVQIICPEFVFCELLLLWLEELWVRLTDWHDDGGQVDLIADWPTNNNYWPLRSAAVALTESEGTCKILAIERQRFANNKVRRITRTGGGVVIWLAYGSVNAQNYLCAWKSSTEEKPRAIRWTLCMLLIHFSPIPRSA